MKLPQAIITLPFLFSTLSAQVAEDKKEYVLAKEEQVLPVGKKVKVVKTNSMQDAKMKLVFQGQNIEGKMSTASNEEFVYDFVDKDTIKISVGKKRQVTTQAMMGMPEQPQEEKSALEGRTVVLKKKEGKFKGTLEGDPVKGMAKTKSDEEVKEFESQFNENRDAKLYGTEGRKIGDSWEVDPSLLPGMDDMKIQGGKLTLTFVEVKEFQGEDCAVLDVKFEVKGDAPTPELKGVDLEFGGTAQVLRSLKHHIDLKFSGGATMTMAGAMEPQPGMKMDMMVKGNTKMEFKRAFAKEKAE